MTSQVAAFFDLDNTIVPGPAIELEYFRLLRRSNLVGLRDLVRSAAVLLKNVPPFSLDPLRRYKAYLVGKAVTEIEAPARAFFWENICPRISEDARRTIEEHRSKGHRLVLLTGCPEFLVRDLATFLKLEDVSAGRLECDGRQYTGHMLAPYPYRQGKRIVAERFAADHGIDLTVSYMYGDSPGDLAVLEAVGNPRVVNPIRGMAAIARKRRWPILRWQ